MARGDNRCDASIVNPFGRGVIICSQPQQAWCIPVGRIKAYRDRASRLGARWPCKGNRRTVGGIERHRDWPGWGARQGHIDAITVGGQQDLFGDNFAVERVDKRRWFIA